jgi:hypothetical protein
MEVLKKTTQYLVQDGVCCAEIRRKRPDHKVSADYYRHNNLLDMNISFFLYLRRPQSTYGADRRHKENTRTCWEISVWTGSSWLRIGNSRWLLWTRWWTFRFCKILESSLAAAQLAGSQEGLSSVSKSDICWKTITWKNMNENEEL